MKRQGVEWNLSKPKYLRIFEDIIKFIYIQLIFRWQLNQRIKDNIIYKSDKTVQVYVYLHDQIFQNFCLQISI